jgi:hypothetical protein
MLILLIQQPGTEKQMENEASFQNGCARTTVSRQFKCHATIARNNHNQTIFFTDFCSEIHFIFLKILGILFHIFE